MVSYLLLPFRGGVMVFALQMFLNVGAKAMYFDCPPRKVTKLLLAAMMSAACVLPAHAMAQSKAAPVFMPSRAWDVSATELVNIRGLAGTKMPCVMSNEFDNGFVMRLSGGGQKMLAMAIDFRQEVFAKGHQYNGMVALGDSYIKQAQATAFTSSTLIFNLRSMADFYAQIAQQKSMDISVDGNDFRFSLEGIGSSFAALESCYNGEKTKTIEPLVADKMDTRATSELESGGLKMPPSLAKTPLPRSFDEIIAGSDSSAPQATLKKDESPSVGLKTMTPLPGDVPSSSSAAKSYRADIPARVSREIKDASTSETKAPVMKVAPSAPATTPDSKVVSAASVPEVASTPKSAPISMPTPAAKWTAFAGESLRSVLARWSVDAGYNLDWQANSAATIPQDVSLNSSFEEAVNQLLAEAGASDGMAASVENASVQNSDVASDSATVGAAWQADKGANIQDVINLWAARAGVKVAWSSFTSLPVKSSQSSRGSFESALQTLLDQYKGDKVRPFATLNEDPVSGEKTLTMNMEK